VLDQLMQLEPDLIVHLGDIYYAGTIDECRTNFLVPIQAAREKYGRNIPGNHDYLDVAPPARAERVFRIRS
jgi:3',5'-cyclic AMP phosphodiesterase CpdA